MPTTFGEVKWQKMRERNNMANESDWKLFRKRLPEWQERHMQSLLDEYAAIIAGDGDAAAKFWVVVYCRLDWQIANELQIWQEGDGVSQVAG